jgi:uncharacterized protein YuzE
MSIKYLSDSDELTIWLTSEPAVGDSAEVAEGVVLFYDAQDRIVGLTIGQASTRADLNHYGVSGSLPRNRVDKSPLGTACTARDWGLDSGLIAEGVNLRLGKLIPKGLARHAVEADMEYYLRTYFTDWGTDRSRALAFLKQVLDEQFCDVE